MQKSGSWLSTGCSEASQQICNKSFMILIFVGFQTFPDIPDCFFSFDGLVQKIIPPAIVSFVKARLQKGRAIFVDLGRTNMWIVHDLHFLATC